MLSRYPYPRLTPQPGPLASGNATALPLPPALLVLDRNEPIGPYGMHQPRLDRNEVPAPLSERQATEDVRVVVHGNAQPGAQKSTFHVQPGTQSRGAWAVA